MFGGGRELKELELRRRELVLQSTLHRLTMQAEWQNLRSALSPAERIVSSVQAVRPWLWALAPLAGLFAARGFRGNGNGNGSGFSRAIGVLKSLLAVLRLWKQFETLSRNGTPESQAGETAPEPRV